MISQGHELYSKPARADGGKELCVQHDFTEDKRQVYGQTQSATKITDHADTQPSFEYEVRIASGAGTKRLREGPCTIK